MIVFLAWQLFELQGWKTLGIQEDISSLCNDAGVECGHVFESSHEMENWSD